KLRTLHAPISPTTLTDYARSLSGLSHHVGNFRANRIGKSDMRDNAIAEVGVHAVAGAVEKLVGNHEFQRPVLLFKRAHRRYGDDPLHPQLLEAVNICPKIQLGRKNAMSSAVSCQESDFTPLKSSQNIGIGRRAERGSQFKFFDLFQPGHGIQAAAPDDAYFRPLQSAS